MRTNFEISDKKIDIELEYFTWYKDFIDPLIDFIRAKREKVQTFGSLQNGDFKKFLRYNAIASIKWCHKYNIPISSPYLTNPQNKLIKVLDTRGIFPNEKISKDPWLTVEGQYSVVYPSHAEIMIKIIRKHLFRDNLNMNESVIIDGTANVGGFVLTAAKYFKKVHAVELSEMNMIALKNNIEAYNRKNVELHLGDCTEVMKELQHNVIFLDPPWGGPYGYAEEAMNIKLSNYTMADIINEYNKSLIVLRLPKNYDYNSLIQGIKVRRSTTVYSVSNYYLVVI